MFMSMFSTGAPCAFTPPTSTEPGVVATASAACWAVVIVPARRSASVTRTLSASEPTSSTR